MAASKSLVSLSTQAALLFLVIALAVQTRTAQAQSCTTELSSLNVCAPFVLPGTSNSNPSANCCGALQSVPHDCLCSTLRIAAQLPSQCNLPPLACGKILYLLFLE
ncbi:LTP_2 domain-containing protein [Fagus crenata]